MRHYSISRSTVKKTLITIKKPLFRKSTLTGSSEIYNFQINMWEKKIELKFFRNQVHEIQKNNIQNKILIV